MAVTKSTRRLQLLDSLLACLKRVKKGDPIRPGGTTVFCSTIKKCFESRVGLTEVPDGQFPLVVIEGQETTTFRGGSDAGGFSAVWPLTIWIATKDPSKPKIGQTRQLRLLETLFQDISRSLYCGDGSDPCSIGGQATLELSSWTIHTVEDPTFGIASLDVTIYYDEILTIS